jgi:hypothetical protein
MRGDAPGELLVSQCQEALACRVPMVLIPIFFTFPTIILRTEYLSIPAFSFSLVERYPRAVHHTGFKNR